MNNSNRPTNRPNDLLGVNRMGRTIRKTPIHQPNFTNTARPQPQPQVYNINKNDFRNVVQQLTGSPSHEALPRPPQNQRRPPSNRLQRIRPPPLMPINRPQLPNYRPPPPVPVAVPPRVMDARPYNNNNFGRPPPQYGHPQPPPLLPRSPIPESPISAYMRYLEHSFIDSGPRESHPQMQLQPPPHSQMVPRGPDQNQARPHVPPLPSPRTSGPPPPPPLPSPRLNGPPPPLPSPRMNGPPPPLPSPQMNGPPHPLHSPQFVFPSPTSFMNMLSPKSPYPSLSPGFQHPPPLSPNFSFSPMAQPGLVGPGPQPPLSPGYGFPSPSAFFPLLSPRWREQ